MLMSWDIKSGYLHFYRHPNMRDYFLLRKYGNYYQCISLPFGKGRSVLWFMNLLRPLVQYVKENLRYRLLSTVRGIPGAMRKSST